MKAKHTDCLLIRHDALGLLMKHTVWSVDFDTSFLKMHDAEIISDFRRSEFWQKKEKKINVWNSAYEDGMTAIQYYHQC